MSGDNNLGHINEILVRNPFDDIKRIAERINAPEMVVKTATDIIEKMNHVKPHMDAVPAACLYIACRQNGFPRSFRELCGVAESSQKLISRCFSQISRELGTPIKHISTGEFVLRFCTETNLPQDVQDIALAVTKAVEDSDYVKGPLPVSIAAGVVYMVSQAHKARSVKRSVKEISSVSGVSGLTVCNIYRLHLYPRAKLFLKEFKDCCLVDLLPKPKNPLV